MKTDNQSKYGLGQNPPYSLYQSENGKWGLIDGSGTKLEAVFTRGNNDCFASVPWEVVTFNPVEGFEIQAWFDPFEAWFNFTFDNPAYPPEFAGFLWRPPNKTINDYRDILYTLMPVDRHWLLDEIFKHNEADQIDDDEEYDQAIGAILKRHPEVDTPENVNPLLDPIMRNDNVEDELKHILWNEKVALDSSLRLYKYEYPNGL